MGCNTQMPAIDCLRKVLKYHSYSNELNATIYFNSQYLNVSIFNIILQSKDTQISMMGKPKITAK